MCALYACVLAKPECSRVFPQPARGSAGAGLYQQILAGAPVYFEDRNDIGAAIAREKNSKVGAALG